METLTQKIVEKNLLKIGFKLISKYQGWDKKIRVKCVICDETSYKIVSNIRKGCGKSCAKKRRRLRQIKKHGSLADHPFLVKEYSNENILPPEEVPCNYSAHLSWVCSKCGHKWKAQIYRRINPKNDLKKKYTVCRGKCLQEASNEKNIEKSLKKYGSFAENYPDLMKEFDFEKNTVDSNKITRFSHQIAYWKCKVGHTWPSTFANRSAGENNCPKCKNFKTSRAEIRIYTELKLLFKNILWSDRSTKKELDIFLPDYKFAIEIDGYHHLGFEKVDIKKNKFLRNLGIKVLRLRDFKLKTKISRNDFIVRTGDIKINDIKTLLKKLLKLIRIQPDEKKHIKEYLIRKSYLNDKEYKTLIELLPGVPFERSLAKLFPKIAKQWNYKLNHPLKPEYFTRGSHFQAYWNCPSCSKPYKTKVLKKTQRPNSTCRDCAYIIIKAKNKERRTKLQI
ncbi:zinc-ribbon domain-containing protein [Candidatus Pelagibacter bacterium]|nr:zinc-ribbon domain-containing protein [Candidatus Pelagibacter bacterium]